MPDRISFFKTAALLLEGPNVQIIFVLLIFAPLNLINYETVIPEVLFKQQTINEFPIYFALYVTCAQT